MGQLGYSMSCLDFLLTLRICSKKQLPEAMAVQLVENVLGSQHSFKHLEHPDRSAVSLHVNVPDLAALGDARWEVRADALHQLLGLEGPQLAPYAEAVLPLVADPVSEVRRRACELIHKLDITVLHGLKDVESPRMSFLRCGKTWKCLCVPGSMPVPPSHLTADLQDLHSKQEDSEGSSHRTACTQLPRHLADGFNTPKAIGRSRPQEVDERLLAEMGHGHPVDSIEWLGTLVNAPNLLEMANEGNEGNEGHWYHWKVRDALAFSVRELQGTALVQLLADAETVVREDALIALRRLPSHLWVHHTRWVTQSLVDPMPQVRMAALCALQRLSSVELALQASSWASCCTVVQHMSLFLPLVMCSGSMGGAKAAGRRCGSACSRSLDFAVPEAGPSQALGRAGKDLKEICQSVFTM